MSKLINRKPVVSGRFYPSHTDDLLHKLQSHFNKVKRIENIGHIHAIISPHAGYAFSGTVAASAFVQINKETKYKNIFVLAPSHHVAFNGASIYNIGNYETPLGEIEVNIELANKLVEKHKCFSFYGDAHLHEHSLEVQLPFVQYWLKPGYKLIPIVIGTQNIKELKSISEALAPYFIQENLFIISSDFSHFPNYNDAIEADKRIADAILSKAPEKITQAINDNNKENYRNLATSACGIAGIYCLMYLMQNKNELIIDKIRYLNSGDNKYGDHDRVVGYLSFAIHSTATVDIQVKFNEEEKNELLGIARNSIEAKIKKQSFNVELKNTAPKLKNSYGVFVSLHKQGKLRGCVGRFDTNEPLYNLVKTMALAAAFNDTRFNPVTIDELNDIEIELSVLSPLHEIKSKDEITIGKHGIYIKDGFRRGTLLPQVAVKNKWNVDEFLGYCSKNKAGLGWDGWKTAKLYIYSATIFSE